MRKIALYPRVSTKEAAKRKEGSIKAQIERLQMRVDDKNRYNEGKWGQVVDIYKDEARSGKDTNRPEYQRMLSDVMAGRVDTIMVTELSRINRSVVDFLGFMKFCRDHRADFICLQYDFDTTTPMGKMLITIMAALYEFEREQTIERIRNNYYVRSLRGLLNGGSPILGYDADPNQPGSRIINPVEAESVKTIFDLYTQEGRSLGEVVRLLGPEEKNIANKSWITKEGNIRGGQPFTRSALNALLTNHSYIAIKEINAERRYEDQDALKEEERYQIVPAPWKPIISEEQFQCVQGKLEKNREMSRIKEERNYDFLLTGLLRCDECGRPLVGTTAHGAKQDHYYYSHSPSKKSSCRIPRYSAPLMEELILKEMQELLTRPEELGAFVARVQQKLDSGAKNIDSLLAQLKRESEELETRKRNLVNILSSHADASQLKSLLDEVKRIEEQVAVLDNKREDLKIKRVQQTAHQADTAHVIESIQRYLSKDFARADLSQKRAILQDLFAGLSIHPDNVIRLDVWSTRHHPKAGERASKAEAGATSAALDGMAENFVKEGVVLPFRPKTHTPETQTGDPLLPAGEQGVACSHIEVYGRGGGIRTHDPLLPNGVIFQASTRPCTSKSYNFIKLVRLLLPKKPTFHLSNFRQPQIQYKREEAKIWRDIQITRLTIPESRH